MEKSPENSFAVTLKYPRANRYYKTGIDTKTDINNETQSTAFNPPSKNVQSLLGRNTSPAILQREGLGMYLCLINVEGGGISAANKQSVVFQRCLPGSSPRRDTTQRRGAQGKNSHEACLRGRATCSQTFSAVYICWRAGGACFLKAHTIINNAGSCDDKR